VSAFLRGARLFDDGAFFEAHEVWEEHWRGATDETERRFYQGLIQVAAALHKLLVMTSPAAASRLFARALAKLDACPVDLTREGGFDLAVFRSAVHGCADALAADRFDRAAVPLILRGASPIP
jgi:Domain of unknown function (DUF309)